MPRRSSFLDGVMCTCGMLRDEIEVLACEICGEGCCDSCLVECDDCSGIVCRNCKSVFQETVCQNCEEPYIKKLHNDKSDIKLDDKIRVHLLVDGRTYSVKNNQAAADLIALTNPIIAFSERIKYLDIKGLGLLKYSYRQITFNKGKEDYFLAFTPCVVADDLPFYD
jgi:hypothetical protein